nr:hypothetical protein CFP56_06921 [Quercus suber]
MSYKNPRCSAKFLAKKLVKKVRRQPDIKLRDIQEVVHEKYVVNISVGKASRAREKAQEFVDGSYVEKYNQLWDYYAELRRSSLGNTVLMKTHTFNEGDLVAEMDLQLEDIRLYLMSRFQQNRNSIMREESELSPKLYLAKGVCCCRKWDITSIPCYHVVSCIFFNKEQAEKYANACYQANTYKAYYEHTIDPLNGANMWTPTSLPPVQPPIKKRPPGRPKKKRVLEPNEPRRGHSKGLGIAKRCKTCGKIGYNKRSCKGEVGGISSLPGAQN